MRAPTTVSNHPYKSFPCILPLLRCLAKAYFLVHFGLTLLFAALMHGLTGHPRINHAEGVATSLDYWECVLNADRAEGANNGAVGEERRRGSAGGSPDTAGGRGRGLSSPRFIGGAAPCYLDIALYGQVSYETRPLSSHEPTIPHLRCRLQHLATKPTAADGV